VELLGRDECLRLLVGHGFGRLAVVVQDQPLIFPMFPGSLPLVSAMDEYVGVAGLSAPDNPIYNGCCFHAPNEHIRVADITLAVRHTRRLLEDLHQPPRE